jgi:hypothetical protein
MEVELEYWAWVDGGGRVFQKEEEQESEPVGGWLA